MSIAALITDLIAAGTPAELVGRVAAALAEREVVTVQMKDEAAERRRAADRERKENVRRNLRKSAESAEIPSPQVSEVFPQTPFPNLPNPIPSKKDPKGSKKGSPISELSAVLSPQTANAVVEHRQRIRKPLTAHAAKLLAGKFSACSDPDAAADAMIANGWQGFEPEWLNRAHSPPFRNSKPNYVDALNEILSEANHERPQGQIHNRDAERMAVLDWRPKASPDDVPPSG